MSTQNPWPSKLLPSVHWVLRMSSSTFSHFCIYHLHCLDCVCLPLRNARTLPCGISAGLDSDLSPRESRKFSTVVKSSNHFNFLYLQLPNEWQMGLAVLWNLSVIMNGQLKSGNEVYVASVFDHLCWLVGREETHPKLSHTEKLPNQSHSLNFPTSSLESLWLHFPLLRDEGLGIV